MEEEEEEGEESILILLTGHGGIERRKEKLQCQARESPQLFSPAHSQASLQESQRGFLKGKIVIGDLRSVPHSFISCLAKSICTTSLN